MTTFISVFIIIVSVLLGLVILLQNSKGGGLSGGFGGLGANAQMFGVRRTADALSKATVVLAALFFILCILMEVIVVTSKSDATESILQKGAVDIQETSTGGNGANQQETPTTESK